MNRKDSWHDGMMNDIKTVAYAGKNFGKFKVMAGLVGGPGGGQSPPPPDTGEISKICEKNL